MSRKHLPNPTDDRPRLTRPGRGAAGVGAAAIACSLWLLPAAVLAAGKASGSGATPNAAGIYTCVDAQGRRHTSDRPIPECLDREQRLLNRDGSQRKVVGPRQSDQERLAAETARRDQEAAAQAHKDAVRRDRNLMARFPNEEAHQRARQSALDDIRKAVASSEKRIADLKAERKPLLADAEFYKGKALPHKLRLALEGNQASQEAQADIIQNHRAEMVRIDALYDTELAHLRKLWAGAEPGSLAASGASVARSGR